MRNGLNTFHFMYNNNEPIVDISYLIIISINTGILFFYYIVYKLVEYYIEYIKTSDIKANSLVQHYNLGQYFIYKILIFIFVYFLIQSIISLYNYNIYINNIVNVYGLNKLEYFFLYYFYVLFGYFNTHDYYSKK